jgi:hypothetical protein
LNSGLHTCKVAALLLESRLYPRSFWRDSKGIVLATIPNVKFLTSASLQNKIVMLMKPQRALNKTLIREGGEMAQALYAHMNNKTIKNKIK